MKHVVVIETNSSCPASSALANTHARVCTCMVFRFRCGRCLWRSWMSHAAMLIPIVRGQLLRAVERSVLEVLLLEELLPELPVLAARAHWVEVDVRALGVSAVQHHRAGDGKVDLVDEGRLDAEHAVLDHFCQLHQGRQVQVHRHHVRAKVFCLHRLRRRVDRTELARGVVEAAAKMRVAKHVIRISTDKDGAVAEEDVCLHRQPGRHHQVVVVEKGRQLAAALPHARIARKTRQRCSVVDRVARVNHSDPCMRLRWARMQVLGRNVGREIVQCFLGRPPQTVVERARLRAAVVAGGVKI
eukprot:m.140882 g.140882  ORF g.140882 m.140882 type:complete len:300 (-) comp16680_c2_seq10:563-1462(-)